MKYWEEMGDKFGFSDGDAVPEDARRLRDIYLTAVNSFAIALGSAHRAIKYDRPGVHNPCMILLVSASDIALQVQDPQPVFPDDEMQQAIEEAMEMGLDCYVETIVKVDSERLEKDLQRIRSSLEKQKASIS